MSRCQLASLIVLVAASPAAAQPGGSFVDDDGNHHEGMIEAIFAAGITLGCDPAADNLYCPGDLVTRGQMASFLVRALELSGGTDAFDDDDGSTHEAAINALAAAGITEGCASDKFCPSDPVTRDQMASFLARGYQLAPSATDFFDDDDGNTPRGRHQRAGGFGYHRRVCRGELLPPLRCGA